MGRPRKIPLRRHDGLDALCAFTLLIYMCWPGQGDAVRRKRALDRLKAEDASAGDVLDRKWLTELLRKHSQRVRDGAAAGNLLLSRCQLHAAGRSASLENYDAFIKAFRNTEVVSTHPSAFERQQPWFQEREIKNHRNTIIAQDLKYQSVAHFWAAWVLRESCDPPVRLEGPLDVPEFVALANGIADYACDRNLKGPGGRPFLDAKILWRTDIDEMAGATPFVPPDPVKEVSSALSRNG